MPEPGIYQLRYHLDPYQQWDEGEGEGNNQGRMRGNFRVRR
jgi:hypothetical protein